MENDDLRLETTEVKAASLEAISNYWTEETRAKSKPRSMRFEEESPPFIGETQPDRGEPETKPTVAAQDKAGAAAWDPQPSCPGSGSNTELVPSRGIMPYAGVGKLYMTFGNGDFVGSAWVIASGAVFTAGHCLYDKDHGGWAQNILFEPQYDEGDAPLSGWTAVSMCTLQGWSKNGDFSYDMSCFKTQRPIGPVTGTLGWLCNYPPNQGPYTSVGYPAESPFDGEKMWRNTGNYRGGSGPIQMWNSMTGGCSGGPWVVWKDGEIYVNGLNSFGYSNDPNSIYSPYFGPGFVTLKDWIAS